MSPPVHQGAHSHHRDNRATCRRSSRVGSRDIASYRRSYEVNVSIITNFSAADGTMYARKGRPRGVWVGLETQLLNDRLKLLVVANEIELRKELDLEQCRVAFFVG